MTMTLYDFLKLVKADFDTYDTVFDIEVTACEPYESSQENMEWYDKYYNFILKHVEFVEKTGEYSCVANWYKFIKDNMETFRECANDMWKEGTVPDDEDDFIYEWIEEINGWLAGYVSENEYKIFMEKYAPKIKEV